MDNIVEKIRKLLAKATSQNEHEAQAALLKARELMAKHKISEERVKDTQVADRKLVMTTYQDKTYSPNVNCWYPMIGGVIAEAHCCACVVGRVRDSVKRFVRFTGLGDDPVIALEIFTYAVRHIEDRIKAERPAINAKYKWQDTRNYAVRRFGNSYSEGFARGLKRQYEEQMIPENNECVSLVMVRPVEVDNFVKGLNVDHIQLRQTGSDYSAFKEGQEAGYRFTPTKQITEGQEAAV